MKDLKLLRVQTRSTFTLKLWKLHAVDDLHPDFPEFAYSEWLTLLFCFFFYLNFFFFLLKKLRSLSATKFLTDIPLFKIDLIRWLSFSTCFLPPIPAVFPRRGNSYHSIHSTNTLATFSTWKKNPTFLFFHSSKSLRKKVFLQTLPISYKFKYQSIDAIVKMTFFFCLTNLISVT